MSTPPGPAAPGAGFARARSASASASQACNHPCAAQRAEDNTLSAITAHRIAAIQGYPERAEGPTSLDGPVMYSASATPCQRRAYQLGPTLRRFNRYRRALPYARAAHDMNQLGDEPGGPNPSTQPCLTRLSDDAATLTRQLGLPEGTINNNDLRNDKTGYRAALYRDEQTGRLIMVSRDTQPHSMVDWQTNTRNGDGQDTDQYKAARNLAARLHANQVPFDLAGYSKGGGLAQEAGLVSARSQVFVFNSAGLHEASLPRTGQQNFASLAQRTQSFSSENDFLTFMNQTVDPAQRIRNAEFLRHELAGENTWVNPLGITYRSPALPSADRDGAFERDRQAYLAELDTTLRQMRANHAAGRPVSGFPAVRAGQHETIRNSGSALADTLGAKDSQPTLGKLAQHRMSSVLEPLEKNVQDDRRALQDFLRRCG